MTHRKRAFLKIPIIELVQMTGFAISDHYIQMRRTSQQTNSVYLAAKCPTGQMRRCQNQAVSEEVVSNQAVLNQPVKNRRYHSKRYPITYMI